MMQIDERIEKLSNGDEAERIYAAEDIGYANQAAGVSPLVARLVEEPSRAVREAIFAALLQIEDDAVITAAISMLDSQDSFIRNQAVELLRTRGRRALPYLDRAFREGSHDRRKFVVDVIANPLESAAMELYERALNDPDLNVVITAVENLGNSRQVRFRERIERLILPEAHPMLLGACLEALAQIAHPASLARVRQLLGRASVLPACLLPSYLKLVGAAGIPDDIEEVADAAAVGWLDGPVLTALSSLTNRFPDLQMPPVWSVLLQGIASRNPAALAYQAVRLLTPLAGDDEVFAFLVRKLDDGDKVVRIAAIQVLQESGDARAAAVLRERMASESDAEILQVWNGEKAQ
jgi:HEAT repeat protein